MKNVFLSLILCLSLIVVSCSELGQPKEKLLIGEWQLETIESYDKNGNLTGTSIGSSNEDRLYGVKFTDAVMFVFYDYEDEMFQYTFDEDNQWIVSGAVIRIVTKLTKDELVYIYDMSLYKSGEHGWDVLYFKKGKIANISF